MSHLIQRDITSNLILEEPCTKLTHTLHFMIRLACTHLFIMHEYFIRVNKNESIYCCSPVVESIKTQSLEFCNLDIERVERPNHDIFFFPLRINSFLAAIWKTVLAKDSFVFSN